MTEPMPDKRLAEIRETTQRRDYQHAIVLGDCTEECGACAITELLAEVERLRADAARCRATNESELYGTIRCDKPTDHEGDHEAQTSEAYSQWIRKDAASSRRLDEAIARVKRAERKLAEHPDEWGVAPAEDLSDAAISECYEAVARKAVTNNPEHRTLMQRRAASPWREAKQ